MLASLRLSSVRHALVIMLMILSALVAVERAQAVINSVQHALAIEHGAATIDLAATDNHHQSATDGGFTDAGDRDHAPGPHHHHSEGPQLAAMDSPLTVDIAISRSDALFVLAETGSPQSRIFGLERPPKTLGERA